VTLQYGSNRFRCGPASGQHTTRHADLLPSPHPTPAANTLKGKFKGKGGVAYQKWAAVALETVSGACASTPARGAGLDRPGQGRADRCPSAMAASGACEAGRLWHAQICCWLCCRCYSGGTSLQPFRPLKVAHPPCSYHPMRHSTTAVRGILLQTMFPDAINQPNFPPAVLYPSGKAPSRYEQRTIWRFFTANADPSGGGLGGGLVGDSRPPPGCALPLPGCVKCRASNPRACSQCSTSHKLVPKLRWVGGVGVEAGLEVWVRGSGCGCEWEAVLLCPAIQLAWGGRVCMCLAEPLPIRCQPAALHPLSCALCSVLLPPLAPRDCSAGPRHAQSGSKAARAARLGPTTSALPARPACGSQRIERCASGVPVGRIDAGMRVAVMRLLSACCEAT